MSLDRKDLRVYFHPDMHGVLKVVADADGLEPAALVEAVMERYLLDRVHAATVIAQAPAVAGLSRIKPVSSGSSRLTPDGPGPARRHARGGT